MPSPSALALLDAALSSWQAASRRCLQPTDATDPAVQQLRTSALGGQARGGSGAGEANRVLEDGPGAEAEFGQLLEGLAPAFMDNLVESQRHFFGADSDVDLACELCPSLGILPEEQLREFLLLDADSALGARNPYLCQCADFDFCIFESFSLAELGQGGAEAPDRCEERGEGNHHDMFLYHRHAVEREAGDGARRGRPSGAKAMFQECRRFCVGVRCRADPSHPREQRAMLRLERPLPLTFADNRALWLESLLREVRETLRERIVRGVRALDEEDAGVETSAGEPHPGGGDEIGAAAATSPSWAARVTQLDPTREGHVSVIFNVARARFTRWVDAIFAELGPRAKDPAWVAELERQLRGLSRRIAAEDLPTLQRAGFITQLQELCQACSNPGTDGGGPGGGASVRLPAASVTALLQLLCSQETTLEAMLAMCRQQDAAEAGVVWRNVDAFWQRELKLAADGSGALLVRCSARTVPYGCRLDDGFRLVKTEATRSIQAVLFRAISTDLACESPDFVAIGGGRGTGKTESVKDFARDLGYGWQVMDSCGLPVHERARRVRRCAKAGLFVVFDDFHTSDEALKQALVEAALTAKDEWRDLHGGSGPCGRLVSSNVSPVHSAVFLAFNDQLGTPRVALDFLQPRPGPRRSPTIEHVYCTPPNIQSLVQEILFYGGFQRSQELLGRFGKLLLDSGTDKTKSVGKADQQDAAKASPKAKFAKVCPQAEPQLQGLPPAPWQHKTGNYDFGLRCVKALVTMARRARMEDFAREMRAQSGPAPGRPSQPAQDGQQQQQQLLREVSAFFTALGRTHPWVEGYVSSDEGAFAQTTELARAIRLQSECAIRSCLEDQLSKNLMKLHAADMTMLLRCRVAQHLVPALMHHVCRGGAPAWTCEEGAEDPAPDFFGEGSQTSAAPKRTVEVVGLKTFAEFLPAVAALPMGLRDKMVVHPAVCALIEWRWSIVRPLWLMELAWFLLLMLAYLAWILSLLERRDVAPGSGAAPARPLSAVLGGRPSRTAILSLVLLTPLLLVEACQARPRARKLMQHSRHFLLAQLSDCLSSVLVAVTVVWDLAANGHRRGSSAFPPLVAFCCLALFYKLVTYLRALRSFGSLIYMLKRIFAMLGPFMLLMALVVVGFGFFFVDLALNEQLQLEDERADPRFYHDLLWSLSRMYRLFFVGDFDTELYFGAEGRADDGGEAAPSASPWKLAAFIFATILVNIVMLNVLIAIVSDGYEEVQSRAREESQSQLVDQVIDFEATYLSHARTCVVRTFKGADFLVYQYPRWLMRLAAAEAGEDPEDFLEFEAEAEADEAAEWAGRIHALRDHMVRSEARVCRRVDRLERKLDPGRMDRLERKLDEVLEKLKLSGKPQ